MNFKSEYKVTFIIPYIGEKVPPYLNLFLNSCSYNSDYQFIIFTNLDFNFTVPYNVKIIKSSKVEIETLIFNKTGIRANLGHFYKICDYKPAFGQIFSDYLFMAPFWGHTDIDLILGNLDKFLSPLLNRYDILSFRKEYHAGSFAVYKNIPEVNSLYKRVKNYSNTLSDPVHYAFDEVSRFKYTSKNIYNYLLEGGSIFETETEVESFTHLLKDDKRTADLKVCFKTLMKEGISPGMILKFNDGSITIYKNGKSTFIDGEEFLLYHFVLEKALNSFYYPNWTEVPGAYYITRYGFHKHRILILFEIIWRRLKVLFIKYPNKLISRIKALFSTGYIVNEQTT